MQSLGTIGAAVLAFVAVLNTVHRRRFGTVAVPGRLWTLNAVTHSPAPTPIEVVDR